MCIILLNSIFNNKVNVTQVLIILELLEHGDLAGYLRKNIKYGFSDYSLWDYCKKCSTLQVWYMQG